MKNLEDKKFEYSIIHLDVLKKEKEIWDDIAVNRIYNDKKMKIKTQVIYL
jgi:hypothetical protein